MAASQRRALTRFQVGAMALACSMISANRYYCQPLLAQMSQTLHLSASTAGLVPTFTQSGIAIGLVLFVPLGDAVERRKLITLLLLGVMGALILTAAVFNTAVLLVAALLTGAFAAASQVIVGLAASMADPWQRGQVVGTVTGGLLIGVLSARTVAGLVGGALGWRAVYLAASAGMAALAFTLALALPVSRPVQALRYRQLIRSLFVLVREERELRESCALGALAFAAMSAFWTTLVFFIAGPPYHYGTTAAGLFGLAGIAGALAAPVVGRISDRHGPRFADFMALLAGLFSFVFLFALGRHLAGLLTGIVLLDLATQANLVTNQTRIYSLIPEAANRLNTIYMSAYFGGGALGAAIGSLVWDHFGWTGLCSLGLTLFAVALTVHRRGGRPRPARSALSETAERQHAACSVCSRATESEN
jgi:predicted MFS family arabinose efflux permease